ncbi:MAG: dephospho-CoA kinase [Pseudolabrys sp.]|nr:dephospho-CoA kinase [Pseudolabrys sp.]MBV9955161.1 dephospho-CoA kinase [Pseudolabrys sp.]
MFVLGLTGSLGMGKSTTAKLFAEEGVPVHDADAVVHRLYESEAVPKIEAAFPGTTGNGKVDRVKLGLHLHRNPADFEKLEAIVHPMVAKARVNFLTANRKARIVVLDIPLLYETAGDEHCDAVVVVSAPRELQRKRVLERPGMNDERFEAILARQVPDAEKRRRADFVVDTSQGLDAARAQVRDILTAAAKMPKRRRTRIE